MVIPIPTIPRSRLNLLPRWRSRALLATLLLLGCSGSDAPTIPRLEATLCGSAGTDPRDIPPCLLERGVISPGDYDRSTRLLAAAEAKVKVLHAVRESATIEGGGRILRSLEQLADMYRRGLLDDSARFHRMLDVVSVAMEIAEGSQPIQKRKLYPALTPHLVWYNYPKVGAFFQPVTTTLRLAHLLPRASAPTDSFVGLADQLYRYALWRNAGGLAFPVWEYPFAWTSGGIRVESPWISSMSQGLALSVFAEVYHRTQRQEWKDRAHEVFNSFRTSWSQGGVMLDDTTHGYWWEEFHPRVMIWNGSVQALVGVGYFWTVTGDSTVKRYFDRGIDALKYYTPRYDTGTWTRYSLTQGDNTVAYHNYHVALLDTLYDLTGDAWVKATADRWRAYTPPARVY